MEKSFSAQGLLFGGWLPGVEFYREETDCLRYCTSFGDRWLNQVSWCDFKEEEIETRVRDITREYRLRKVPANWVLGGAQANLDRITAALVSNGWHYENTVPGMVCDLQRPLQTGENASTRNYKIDRVFSRQFLELWLCPFSSAFGDLTDKAPFLMKMFERIVRDQRNPWELYLLSDSRGPITCGALVMRHGLPMIYYVATTPGYSGQGGGSSMVLHLLQRARELGASQVGLFALSDGQNLYHRLGFRENGSKIITYSL